MNFPKVFLGCQNANASSFCFLTSAFSLFYFRQSMI